MDSGCQPEVVVFLFSFLLTLGVRDSVPTNHRDAQALSKEFPASAHQVIQGKNPLDRWPVVFIFYSTQGNSRVEKFYTK